MKFAYSTNAFKNYSLEYSISLIKDIGFDGIEIMADLPHLYPPYYDEEKIIKLKNLLDNIKLPVSNLNTFTLCAIGDMHHPSWIEKEKNKRNVRIQHTINCIKLASKLNCPNISIQPGGKVEYFSSYESMKLFISSLEKVIPIAKELNIKILVEPEPGLLIENSKQFDRFISEINNYSFNSSDYIIGLNCDIGHFYCAGEDPSRIIKKFKDIIGHIHIEDIKNRIHDHKILGHGDIDFIPIFDTLKEIDYKGFISVELYPYQDNPVDAGKESLEYIKNLLNN